MIEFLEEHDFDLQDYSSSPLIDQEYVGEVLTDPDKYGRVKVMIEPLFTGIDESMLPWISMHATCYIKPRKGLKVLVKFNGNVYQGYYTAVLINDGTLEAIGVTALSDQFVLDLDKVKIVGRYDGTDTIIETPNTLIQFNDDSLVIKHQGKVKVSGKNVIIQKGMSAILNEDTPCPYTGGNHLSTVTDAFV